MMHPNRRTRSSSARIRVRNLLDEGVRLGSGWLLTIAVLQSLCGCAAHYVRETADDQLRGGSYEQALRTVQDGLKRYPDDPELLTEQREIRARATEHLIAATNGARATRDLDQAEAITRRLLAMDPRSEQAARMLSDIDRDRRHASTLAQ